jgi:hypothetical protein
LPRQRALFTQRLPYHRDTHRIVLVRGDRELGALVVPGHLPEFLLTHPTKSHQVDPHGHLRWELDKASKAQAKKHPLTYHVRYSADRQRWLAPELCRQTEAIDSQHLVEPFEDAGGNSGCLMFEPAGEVA